MGVLDYKYKKKRVGKMKISEVKADQKRPYEYVAFVLFLILFVQQIALIFIRFIQYLDRPAATRFYSTASLTTPGFFSRIIGLGSDSLLYVLLAFLALAFYYALIYILVYRYCDRHDYAKWTWTLLVVFGSSIFFMAPYYFYAAFVFRPYLMRMIKGLVDEYQAIDVDKDKVKE